MIVEMEVFATRKPDVFPKDGKAGKDPDLEDPKKGRDLAPLACEGSGLILADLCAASFGNQDKEVVY